MRTIGNMKNTSELMQKGPETETTQDKPDIDTVSDYESIEAERHLEEYVGMVILQVFQRCKIYRDNQKQDMAWHKERLLNLIMDELPKDLVPSIKSDRMAQSVYKEMCRMFVKKPKRVIRRHYPHVPPVCEVCAPLVECFHCKLKEHSGEGPPGLRYQHYAAVCGGIVVGVLIMAGLQLLPFGAIF